MWSIDPTYESLTLCEKYWPYLWNTNTTCETPTPLTNRSHYVGNVYRRHPTGESVANLGKILPVTNWLSTGQSLTLLCGTLISLSTDYLVNHTHTHTHTHHAMAQGREGSIPHYNIQHPAMYLTTVFNIQQYTSSQHSMPIKIPYHNTQHPVHGFCQFHQTEKEVHQHKIWDCPAALKGEVGFSLSTSRD